MSVDVDDFVRAGSSILQRCFDGARGTSTGGVWLHHRFAAIRGQTSTCYFGVHAGAASLGMFKGFKNQNRATLGKDKSIAALVPRT